MARRNSLSLWERDLANQRLGSSHATSRLLQNDESKDRTSFDAEMNLLTLVLLSHAVSSIIRLVAAPTSDRFRRAEDNRIIGVSLDVLLQVLRALECFATEVAFVRFQGYVDPDMRGDMIALDGGGTTVAPLTSQVQIVRTLATDMALANMVLDESEVNAIVARSSC